MMNRKLKSISWFLIACCVCDKSALEKWSQLTAAEELKCLNQYLERRKTDLMSQEPDASWKLFMDPRKRKIWFQNAYGLQNSGCPNFAIDWKGVKTYDPAQIKEIYLREGTSRLKIKLEIPADEKESIVPDLP